MAKVTIQSSGHQFEVRLSQTVLQAAIEAGVNLPYGCRNGACGSCKGKLISGKVMHDDYQRSAMTDEELAAGNALFCCARPLEDCVIECRELTDIHGIKPRILPTRVLKKEKLSHDVMALYLQLPASERLQFMAVNHVFDNAFNRRKTGAASDKNSWLLRFLAQIKRAEWRFDAQNGFFWHFVEHVFGDRKSTRLNSSHG